MFGNGSDKGFEGTANSTEVVVDSCDDFRHRFGLVSDGPDPERYFAEGVVDMVEDANDLNQVGDNRKNQNRCENECDYRDSWHGTSLDKGLESDDISNGVAFGDRNEGLRIEQRRYGLEILRETDAMLKDVGGVTIDFDGRSDNPVGQQENDGNYDDE